MSQDKKSESPKEKSLSRIAESIISCTKCRLCETRTNAVPGEGSHNARVFFLGEAPGKNEDITGRPFCGAAGKILDMGLLKAGFSRKEVFITSVIKCRPPKNRNPKPDELLACKDYIDAQIRIINPQIIVPLGNYGLKHFFKELSIGQARGQILKKEGLLYYPMLHPAAIIYKRSNMDLFLNDFIRLRSIIDDSVEKVCDSRQQER
ncbi:MAG: uracil-DNA glycosylase [Candidatus Woesearchaeota archaeon]